MTILRFFRIFSVTRAVSEVAGTDLGAFFYALQVDKNGFEF